MFNSEQLQRPRLRLVRLRMRPLESMGYGRVPTTASDAYQRYRAPR